MVNILERQPFKVEYIKAQIAEIARCQRLDEDLAKRPETPENVTARIDAFESQGGPIGELITQAVEALDSKKLERKNEIYRIKQLPEHQKLSETKRKELAEYETREMAKEEIRLASLLERYRNYNEYCQRRANSLKKLLQVQMYSLYGSGGRGYNGG